MRIFQVFLLSKKGNIDRHSDGYYAHNVIKHSFIGENLGCFGGSKKKKEGSSSSNSTSPLGKSDPEPQQLDNNTNTQLGYSVPKGTEMLWSPEVSFAY